MTDLEKFIELYKGFGIKCVLLEKKEWFEIYLKDGCHGGVTQSEKFDGYSGFYSDVRFDKQGKFIKQGFWEW